MATNLTIIRGNTTTISLTAGPKALGAGSHLFMTAKPEYDSDRTDTAGVVIKDITDPAVLTQTPIRFAIEPADTIDIEPGKYVYDIIVDYSDGQRLTLVDGKLTIKPAVTLRGVN